VNNKKKIIEKCKKIFSNIMKIPEKKILDNTSDNNLNSWDSLSHVQLISSLEKNFKIKISPAESLDDCNTFKEIYNLISKKLNIK
tara:strand:+ start:3351 stop:3605 length:255 start_codon:yes stop_codon:yes gene_type:complete